MNEKQRAAVSRYLDEEGLGHRLLWLSLHRLLETRTSDNGG
jgi:hypothetical protein